MTDKMQNCRGKSLKREFPEKKNYSRLSLQCVCHHLFTKAER